MQPEAHDLFSDKTTDILVPNRVPSLWVFPSEPPSLPDPQNTKVSLAMAPSTRSATRNKPRSNSGSVYHESDNSMDVDQQPTEVPLPEPKEEFTTSRGRKTRKLVYAESSSSSDVAPEDENAEQTVNIEPTKPDKNGEVEEEEDHMKTRYQLRNRNRIVDSDEDAPPTGHATRSRTKHNKLQDAVNGTAGGRLSRRGGTRQSKRTKSRKIRQTAQEQHDDDIYVDDNSSTGSADADGSLDDGVGTSSDIDLEDPPPDPAADSSHEDAQDGRTYSLRQRAKINYAIPPPLEEMSAPPRGKAASNRVNGRNGLANGRRAKPPGWSASGAELSRWMGGLPGDDSVGVVPSATQSFLLNLLSRIRIMVVATLGDLSASVVLLEAEYLRAVQAALACFLLILPLLLALPPTSGKLVLLVRPSSKYAILNIDRAFVNF